MKILVINAGSSSLKYQLMNMDNEEVMAKGNCERIGIDGRITHKTASGYSTSEDCAFPTHTEAFEKVVEMLTQGEGKVVDSVSEIAAVGHRIVQGGAIFSQSVLVTDKVIDQIEGLAPLAPSTTSAPPGRCGPAGRSSAKMSRWLPSSTPLSTRRCPPRPTCTACGMRIMSSIPSGNTASTAPPTGLSRQTSPNGSASPWKS